MANPNKTVGNFRKEFGPNPSVVSATENRMSTDEMTQDMEKFQNGKMTAEQFKNKWSK